MPQDDALNARMRAALAAHAGISEKSMMGGRCFFLNGNMLGGARRHKDGISRFTFRVGKDNEAHALADPKAQPVVHGGRKLGGFIHVAADDCDEAALQQWLTRCLDHAVTLPAKA